MKPPQRSPHAGFRRWIWHAPAWSASSVTNPSLNCFITLTAESALQQAALAEQEIQAGDYRGLLHGIPLALKDLYDTAGVRTTAGSRVFADNVPETDAYTVQKLKSAGAVLLGKLNMHEIALGVTNDNPHFGACINPWDSSRITGGSSGGSAAAVAAGLCLGRWAAIRAARSAYQPLCVGW